MAVISINYDDGTDGGYVDVEIHTDDSVKIPFNTGDFVKDWFDCMKYVITGMLGDYYFLSHSSSVNHWIFDDTENKYKSMYLRLIDENNDTWELSEEYSHEKKGIEFFVESDWSGTWKELKEKYDDKG